MPKETDLEYIMRFNKATRESIEEHSAEDQELINQLLDHVDWLAKEAAEDYTIQYQALACCDPTTLTPEAIEVRYSLLTDRNNLADAQLEIEQLKAAAVHVDSDVDLWKIEVERSNREAQQAREETENKGYELENLRRQINDFESKQPRQIMLKDTSMNAYLVGFFQPAGSPEPVALIEDYSGNLEIKQISEIQFQGSPF